MRNSALPVPACSSRTRAVCEPANIGLLLAAAVTLAVLVAHPWPAAAQWVCPYEPGAEPQRCAKLAQRAARLQQRAARDAAIADYRAAHPWRISLLLETSLFALGLGHSNVAGSWGVAAGVSALYELSPGWALRMDGLGRFGRGHISNWNIDHPGPIDTSAGFMGGAELRVASVHRIHAAYLGPVLTVGALGMRAQTLHEADFPDEFEGFEHGFDATVHVPAGAAFLAGGFILGGEPVPRAPVSVNVHFTPGVWNDFRHLYVSAGLDVSIKLFD